MVDYAEHPHQPLSELEVFVGSILNKSGAQTHRQRDRSVKLKDECERITTWITHEMRSPTPLGGHASELYPLELCFACLCIGCERGEGVAYRSRRSSAQDVQGFKVVAAAALMFELSLLEKRVEEY